MNKFFLNILYTLFLVLLLSCQSVSEKIENTTDQEQKELSKWLDKAESELKSFYGQPDSIEFLESTNRNYVYVTEKYKIKCIRKFEVNPKNMIVGFSSKNCF